jgi:phosphatidate cytidylyltransferase
MAGAEAARKSDLGVRTASAAVMLAVAGTALWLGGWWWTGLVALVALAVLREWRGLSVGFARSPAARGLWNAAGLVYVGFAATGLALMRQDPAAGPVLVLAVVGAVIATDIGAYFAGRTFGGPKIAPRISPSKTWSGLIGGMVAAGAWLSLAVPQLCGDACPYGWPNFPSLLALGALIAIVAQAGDFFESWMKRRAGVKDSGTLLPGHGGVFDRVDGLLAVTFLLGIPIAFSRAMELA